MLFYENILEQDKKTGKCDCAVKSKLDMRLIKL